jgi:hypothetical protein
LGILDTNNNYTLNGITITAYGFIKSSTSDIPTELYGINKNTEKLGLGIYRDVDNEINKTTYIQLDLSGVVNKLAEGSVPNIVIQDIQKHEGFTLYGSNTLGSLGDKIYLSSDNPTTQNIPLTSYKSYRYISITASGELDGANVILNSIEYVVCREYINPNT